MQARGVTEKSYVEQCKEGNAPTAAASEPKPTAAAPPPAPKQVGGSAKTAKDCIAEWRADKAGMQARGVTEKSYVEQCKGGNAPPAAAPKPKPTAAAPPPAPKQETPAATQATPAQPKPTSVTKPMTAPGAQTTDTPATSPTLEAGQYAMMHKRKLRVRRIPLFG
jgi:hypothetical protein